MACFHPLKGYRSAEVNPSGKRSITFNAKHGYSDLKIDIPCGSCIGCRLEKSRQWAVRIMHEVQMHEHNSWITLTYDNKNLPMDDSLKVEHFQKFMKLLREDVVQDRRKKRKDLAYQRRYLSSTESNIRYFHCGEYGDNFGRPHYHACLFNVDFADKVHHKTVNGIPHYRSATLEKLWPKGISMIGQITFESAAYVARYTTKKVTGKNAYFHYNLVDPLTGEILAERKPEYATMSRRPGIGKKWYEKYKTDVFPSDFVVTRKGDKMIECRPPKAYLDWLEKESQKSYYEIKGVRKRESEKHAEEFSHDRLMVKEELAIRRFNETIRRIENEEIDLRSL